VLFDRAAMIRLCDARLAGLSKGPAAGLAEQARQALVARDSQAMQRAASTLQAAATDDRLASEASGALQAASLVLEERRP
jgi:DNA polymerase III delta prime subunit